MTDMTWDACCAWLKGVTTYLPTYLPYGLEGRYKIVRKSRSVLQWRRRSKSFALECVARAKIAAAVVETLYKLVHWNFHWIIACVLRCLLACVCVYIWYIYCICFTLFITLPVFVLVSMYSYVCVLSSVSKFSTD